MTYFIWSRLLNHTLYVWWVQSISIQANRSNHSINAFEKCLREEKKNTSNESLIQLRLDFCAWIDPKIALKCWTNCFRNLQFGSPFIGLKNLKLLIEWKQYTYSVHQFLCAWYSLQRSQSFNDFDDFYFCVKSKMIFFVRKTLFTDYFKFWIGMMKKMNSYVNQSCVKVGHFWN